MTTLPKRVPRSPSKRSTTMTAFGWPPRKLPRPSTAWWCRIPPGPAMRRSPAWIMQGYGTMANEAAEQLRQLGVNRPTHVFVQAGVGSLAGAVVGYFTNLYPQQPAQVRGDGGQGGRLPVPGRCGGRWRPPHCGRRPDRPSWRVLPAASPISSPGTSCATMSPPSSPAPTGSAPGACGCWACR